MLDSIHGWLDTYYKSQGVIKIGQVLVDRNDCLLCLKAKLVINPEVFCACCVEAIGTVFCVEEIVSVFCVEEIVLAFCVQVIVSVHVFCVEEIVSTFCVEEIVDETASAFYV